MPTLQWVTRDVDVKRADAVPYRLLEPVAELSGGDRAAGNMLVQGDNLDALKALLPYYAGRVKCVYIDPPYNTRSAYFEHYNDNLEHSQWLAMMYPRLSLLWEFLVSDKGVMLISLNDDELHYGKVICDEIFGRQNFIITLVWNYEGNTDNQAKIINYHEYVLVYAKGGDIPDPGVFDPSVPADSKLFREEIRNTIVKNGPKNPVSTIHLPKDFPCAFESGSLGKRGSEWPRFDAAPQAAHFKLTAPVQVTSGWSSKRILEAFISNGFEPVMDSKGQLTRFELVKSGAIEAVKVREQRKGHFVSVLRGFGTTNQMRLMLDALGLNFTYPKPVNLIEYFIKAFTDKDDIILDAFAGSATTAHAVLEANVRDDGNRTFLAIETSETTAREVAVPRLRACIDGSTAAELQSLGGGFTFYQLGEVIFDETGALQPGIPFRHLAAHIWFSETGGALGCEPSGPFLGDDGERGVALLYNGVLGDRRPDGGNVLTAATLRIVREATGEFEGPLTIYGEASRLGPERLRAERVTFKQTPYDVRTR